MKFDRIKLIILIFMISWSLIGCEKFYTNNNNTPAGNILLSYDAIESWEVQPLCEGWRFSCDLKCKGYSKVSAYTISSDPSDDGRREVVCEALGIVHNESRNLGASCMQHSGGCSYALYREELEYFSYSGPSPICRPPDRP